MNKLQQINYWNRLLKNSLFTYKATKLDHYLQIIGLASLAISNLSLLTFKAYNIRNLEIETQIKKLTFEFGDIESYWDNLQYLINKDLS